ncbi:MAG: T9SS type A sorting domain-containing protein, partial [Bacteroidota bacterium]
QLNWQPAANVDGYHIYRRAQNEEIWTKLTSSPIVSTSYIDNTLTSGGNYFYLIRSTKKITTGSGRYWNQSLGIEIQANSTADLVNSEKQPLMIFPNPATTTFTISGFSATSLGEKATLKDLSGKSVLEFQLIELNQQIDVSHLSSGVYFLDLGNDIQKIVINTN